MSASSFTNMLLSMLQIHYHHNRYVFGAHQCEAKHNIIFLALHSVSISCLTIGTRYSTLKHHLAHEVYPGWSGRVKFKDASDHLHPTSQHVHQIFVICRKEIVPLAHTFRFLSLETREVWEILISLAPLSMRSCTGHGVLYYLLA